MKPDISYLGEEAEVLRQPCEHTRKNDTEERMQMG